MKSVDVKNLKELLDKGASIQLVDVREDWEREMAHIGGIHIPLNQLPEKLQEISEDEEKIVVYCRSGKRSANAIAYLEQNGISAEKLYNLEGGILAWADEIDDSIPKY